MSSILSRSKRFKPASVLSRRSRRRVIDVGTLKQRFEMMLAIENDPETRNGIRHAMALLLQIDEIR